MRYPLLAALFLVTGSLLALALLRAERGSRFDAWNRAFLNQLITTAGGPRNDAAVTFLRVRPTDLEKSKYSPRLDWSVLLNSLLNYQPQAAGIIPPLRWDDPDVLTEGALAKQVKRMPPMALGAIFSPTAPDGSEKDYSKAFLSLDRITGDRAQLPAAQRVAAMPDEELLINGRPGFTHIEFQKELAPRPEGIRLPLVCRLGERVVPSFVLQMIMLREGLLPDDIEIDLAAPTPQMRLGDKRVLPIDATGCITVHPSLTATFPQLDFASLTLAVSPFQEVAQELRNATKEELESLRKNSVIIGFDDASLEEFPLTPSTKVSRSVLLTMGVAAIQSGFLITHWPAKLAYGSLGGLLLLGLLCLALPRWLSVAGGLTAAGAYLGLAWFLFHRSLSWTPPWAGLALCLLMIACGAALPRKTRRRRSLRGSRRSRSLT